MIKKAALTLVLMLLSHGAYAENVYTKQLQDKYADGNIKIEFVVKHKITLDERSDLFSKKGMKFPKAGTIYYVLYYNNVGKYYLTDNKITYARKPGSYYMQFDYPAYETKDEREKRIKEELKLEKDKDKKKEKKQALESELPRFLGYENEHAFKCRNDDGSGTGLSILGMIDMLGKVNTFKRNYRDINIINSDKAWFVDRAQKLNKFCKASDYKKVLEKASPRTLIDADALLQVNFINDILLENDKTKAEYIETVEEKIGEEDYTVEKFKINEVNQKEESIGDSPLFNLFYLNGNLKFVTWTQINTKDFVGAFGSSVSANVPKFIEILSLDKVNDDSIFLPPKDYKDVNIGEEKKEDKTEEEDS